MTRRNYQRAAKLSGAILAAALISALTAVTASAGIVYNNRPSPLPGNIQSFGFECCQLSEVGGQIGFPPSTPRRNPTVEVMMSTWACEKGFWGDNTCQSGGSTFPEEVTLSVYEVGGGNAVGTKIGRTTQTFNMPYRPTASTKCTTGEAKGGWYSKKGKTCFHGKLFPIKFSLTGVNALPSPKSTFVLPSEKAIISVAYNTSNSGYVPKGTQGCSSPNPPGCGYDSLNVALRENPSAPSVGTYPDSGEIYLADTTAGYFCPAGATGVFEPSGTGNCWPDEQPIFKIKAK